MVQPYPDTRLKSSHTASRRHANRLDAPGFHLHLVICLIVSFLMQLFTPFRKLKHLSISNLLALPSFKATQRISTGILPPTWKCSQFIWTFSLECKVARCSPTHFSPISALIPSCWHLFYMLYCEDYSFWPKTETKRKKLNPDIYESQFCSCNWSHLTPSTNPCALGPSFSQTDHNKKAQFFS